MADWDEVLRTTNLVRLSWAEATLHAAGFETRVLDSAISAVEGGIAAFPRRLQTLAQDAPRARALIAEVDPEGNGG